MVRLTAPEVHEMNLDTLLGLAEILANQKADGHITLMRFTTGWKAIIGTPNLDTGEGRAEIANLKSHSSLREALVDLLINQNEL